MFDYRYFYNSEVKKRLEIMERTEGQPDYMRMIALGLKVRTGHKARDIYNKWLMALDAWKEHKLALKEFSKRPVDLKEWKNAKTNKDDSGKG